MVSGLAVEYRPPAEAGVVSGRCPTPTVYADRTHYIPDPAFLVTDPGSVTAGGGLPAGFVPATATRCVHREVPAAEDAAAAVAVREETAASGLAARVAALRRPSVVGRLTGSC